MRNSVYNLSVVSLVISTLSGCVVSDSTKVALQDTLESIERLVATIDEELARELAEANERIEELEQRGDQSATTPEPRTKVENRAPVIEWPTDSSTSLYAGVRPAGHPLTTRARNFYSVDGTIVPVQHTVGSSNHINSLEDYIAFFEETQSLRPFTAAPKINIGMSNNRLTELATIAVQSVNSALPEEFRISISDEPRASTEITEEIYRPGYILLDFMAHSLWPYPSPGASGRTEFLTTWSSGGDPDPSARIFIDTNFATTRPDRQVIAMISHEIVHALGLRGHLTSDVVAETVMHSVVTSDPSSPPHALYEVDRHAISAIYNGLSSADVRYRIPSKPVRIEGSVTVLGAGRVGFGVQSHFDIMDSWAATTAPPFALEHSPLIGTASWTGRMVGLTPDVRAVSGVAGLSIDMDDMTGDLDFTDIEAWGANEPLGTEGTGAVWGDGDLSYDIVVEGNTFVETGGDDGSVTGIFGGRGHGVMGGTLVREDLEAAFGGKRTAD